MRNGIHPSALQNIRITDPLFKHYVSLVADQILPYQWMVLNDQVPDVIASHCVENFRVAAGKKNGKHQGAVFCDTDAYKWIEALAYCLENGKAKAFEPIADELIALIGQAQQADGYLNTYFSINHPDEKWSNLAEGHELYCAGHLIEAAVAYFQATGKDQLLQIAIRFADLIYSVFIVGGRAGYPGHQEIELALVKLYRISGNPNYLALAKHFLEERGKKPNYLLKELERTAQNRLFPEFADYDEFYAQTYDEPVRQKTAEGHAVRAMYMFSAMADVANECNDEALKDTCTSLWQNVTQRRMYITGGIGSSGHLERFTTDYDLPNDRTYCESCASVGLMMFGQRMAELTRDAQYYEVVERVLCNTILAGISKDGDRYFYVNPLEVWPANCLPATSMSHVKPVRQPWYEVACCPTNISRTLASLGQYIYAEDDNSIYINMLISSTFCIKTAVIKGNIEINASLLQKGTATITVETFEASAFNLSIRIPKYLEQPEVTLDGNSLDAEINNGYVVLNISEAGKRIIQISGSVEPVFIAANENVRADVGRLALQYGPYVYCLEQVDNGENLAALFVSANSEIIKGLPIENLPGELPTLHLNGKRFSSGVGSQLYGKPAFSMCDQNLTAVPYALWGNRTPGEMLVWIKTTF
jgi:DUF1680 family protein